jgi:FkbM family methyltransferase
LIDLPAANGRYSTLPPRDEETGMDQTFDAAPLFHRFPLKIKGCRYGAMMFLETDKYIGQSFDLYGEYSEEEVEVFAQMIFPGDVVIDAGANIGAHTVMFAGRVGQGGKVYAFEPQGFIFNLLSANLALNGLRHVQTFRACVGAAPGVAPMPWMDYQLPNNFGGAGANDPRFEVTESAPIMTIDSLGLTRCDFIKIDVEGMEAEAIAGARATIASCQPVLYVEDDRAEKSDALRALLKSLGYRLFSHLAHYYSARNVFRNENNVFGGQYSSSLICLPPRHHGVDMLGFPEL